MAEQREIENLRRFTIVFVSIGCLAVLSIMGLTGFALIRPSAAREITFLDEGDWKDINAGCHGPDVFLDGKIWSACDWAYKRRALVRIDPQDAKATIVYRWEIDDGNVPEIVAYQPCDEGHLFVIGETKQSTLVRITDQGPSVSTIPDRGREIVGAACLSDAIEIAVETLFSKSRSPVVIRRLDNSKSPHSSRPMPASVRAGDLNGAFFEKGSWHFLYSTRSTEDPAKIKLVTTRENQSEPTTLTVLESGSGRYAVGPPVNRLGRRGSVYFRQNPGGWTARTVASHSERNMTLFVGLDPGFGFTSSDEAGWHFSGLGQEPLSLRSDKNSVNLEAWRGQGTKTVIGQNHGFLIAPRAFPMPNGGIALWGRLGNQLMVLDGDLQRIDGLNVWERLGRGSDFSASSKSTFDKACYFIILVITPFYLLILFFFFIRSRGKKGRLILTTGIFLVITLICGKGFYAVILWI